MATKELEMVTVEKHDKDKKGKGKRKSTNSDSNKPTKKEIFKLTEDKKRLKVNSTL
jgi:hypothetical protein